MIKIFVFFVLLQRNIYWVPFDWVCYIVQVNGVWNRWRNVGRPEFLPKPGQKDSCCIVPPVGFVENIGSEGTSFPIDITPVAKRPENVT